MGVEESVGQGGVEGVLYLLHLEGQPSSVSGEVGEELAFVAAAAETGESHFALLGVGIGGALVHIGGGDNRLEHIEFSLADGVHLIQGYQSELGDTHTVVLAQFARAAHLAGIGAQTGRDEVLEPGGLVDTLPADKHEHMLVYDLVVHPRGDHSYKPLSETVLPQCICLLRCLVGGWHYAHLRGEHAYPVALLGGVFG